MVDAREFEVRVCLSSALEAMDEEDYTTAYRLVEQALRHLEEDDQ